MKVCSKCGEEKPESEFYANFKRCKACVNQSNKEWVEKNRERANLIAKRWRLNNPEKHRAIAKRWREKYPEKAKANSRNRDWSKKKISAKAWREKNRDKIRVYDAKRRSTPHGRIDDAMSSGIRQALKREKGNCHWPELVGYTVEELKKHLEKQFTQGMTWDNYGEWHIDHIIPKSAYNYTTPKDIDFLRCWDLRNLRPMWGSLNISKHDKLEKPFQPSLLLQVSL